MRRSTRALVLAATAVACHESLVVLPPLVPVATLTVSPAVDTVTAGDSVQLTATARDSAGNEIPEAIVTRTLGGGGASCVGSFSGSQAASTSAPERGVVDDTVGKPSASIERCTESPDAAASTRCCVIDRTPGLRLSTRSTVAVETPARRAARTSEPTTLTVEELSLDLLSRKVTREGLAIDLRPREFALLEYLMRNAGKVVSKTMILSHVWEYSFDPQTNIVDVLVSRLRDKVDRPFARHSIETVRSLVGANTSPRRVKVLPKVDLVDQRMGFTSRLALTFGRYAARLSRRRDRHSQP